VNLEELSRNRRLFMTASVAEVFHEERTVCLRNILLATDFSNVSEKAFAYAVAIARRHNSKLHVVHVFPDTSALLVPQLAEDQLNEHSRKQMNLISNRPELEDVTHVLTLRTGPVCAALDDAARRENIDLLVLGTHGRGDMKRLVLGSVAEEMIRVAPCPVITVGPSNPGVSHIAGEFHRILFATDFGRASAKAAQYAVFFAKETGAKLTLLHVMPPAPSPVSDSAWSLTDEKTMKEWRANQVSVTAKRMEKLLPSDRGAGFEVEYVVTFDLLYAGILAAAKEKQPDLIVMGADPTLSPKIAAHMPGTVVHQIMCHAACPVLTAGA
jgi:nucleotide-binding universal stress UspA family protein